MTSGKRSEVVTLVVFSDEGLPHVIERCAAVKVAQVRAVGVGGVSPWRRGVR